jgi:hypothetical protein
MCYMEQRFRQLQRATVARSALDVIALIFLCCGFAFWGVAFWQLLTPPALLSLLSIQVVVLGLVYSLATPLLWSALVPSTPAGQLLQKTQWRTFGFAAIVGAAFYLTYQAERLIELWLFAQPGIQQAGFARELAISLSIGFILIPALAWTQLTPERWLQQIQQAHQVKKLEMQQRGELAIIKASILSAEHKALLGWANLLPTEQQEVFGTIRGLLMASSDTQRDIVRTLGLGAELERDIMGDQQIGDQLDYVAQHLNVLPAIAPARAEQAAQVAGQFADAAARDARQDAIPASPQPPVKGAGIAAPQRPAAPRSAPQRYATDYDTAIGMLTGNGWTVHALADVLGVAERTARDRLNAWSEQGLVAQSDTKGRFYFTERESRT